MEKSYCALEKKICVVCGEKYETNGILLEKSLKDVLPKYVVTGFGVCPEHSKEGYITLVEIDPEKSDIKNGEGRVSDYYRTGVVIYMKRDAYREVFSGDANKEFAFISTEATQHLKTGETNCDTR